MILNFFFLHYWRILWLFNTRKLYAYILLPLHLSCLFRWWWCCRDLDEARLKERGRLFRDSFLAKVWFVDKIALSQDMHLKFLKAILPCSVTFCLCCYFGSFLSYWKEQLLLHQKNLVWFVPVSMLFISLSFKEDQLVNTCILHLGFYCVVHWIKINSA